jgi:VIT1/CCC1 family predicted Fe2+/Mn2+ transporter
LTLGFSDGTLTALTFGAGRLIGNEAGIDFELAGRIAVAVMITNGFVFLVARYSELRHSLVNAERELSMSRRLADTALGRSVLVESVEAASIAALAGLPGALLPLATGALAGPYPWLAIVAALAVLAGLGVVTARSVGGSMARWAGALLAAGVVLSIVGAILRVA